MKPGALVLLTPDELRALVADAVADGLAKAGGERAEQSEIMTCEQAAALIGVHPYSVPKYVRDDGLPSLRRIGNQWRFRRSDVLAWLQKRKSA